MGLFIYFHYKVMNVTQCKAVNFLDDFNDTHAITSLSQVHHTDTVTSMRCINNILFSIGRDGRIAQHKINIQPDKISLDYCKTGTTSCKLDMLENLFVSKGELFVIGKRKSIHSNIFRFSRTQLGNGKHHTWI
jgi:hypothetical protein